MNNAFFVAGTDTDAGKTVASRAILQAAAQRGIAAAGFKPVASGSEVTEQGNRNSDALILQAASSVALDYEEVNPYTFIEASSPHLASRKEQVTIETSVIDNAFAHLKTKSALTLVEGAGGWRVPLTETQFLSEWVVAQRLPVILVVGMKLGCINHAILSAEAIQADGLEVVGWVANRVNPAMENYADVVAMLARHLPGQKLGEIPYMPNVNQRDLANYIDLSALL